MNQAALITIANELTHDQMRVLMALLAELDYENYIQVAQMDIAEALNMQKTNIFLATHRISCDDFSFNIQHVKKFWDSCNLIRFLIRLDLSDDQTVHC